jgi:hypothetical protein
MTEAATKLGVTHHRIRRLIKDRVLAAEQVVPGAPYQIRASDLQDERVVAAVKRTGRPCRDDPEKPTSNVYRHLKKRGTMNASARTLTGIPSRRHVTPDCAPLHPGYGLIPDAEPNRVNRCGAAVVRSRTARGSRIEDIRTPRKTGSVDG